MTPLVGDEIASLPHVYHVEVRPVPSAEAAPEGIGASTEGESAEAGGSEAAL